MSGIAVDLIHRQAWPSRHHFSLSRGEPETLNVLVVNPSPTVGVYIQPAFSIQRPDGATIDLFGAFVFVPPESEEHISAVFVPSMFGVHHVTARLFYDVVPLPTFSPLETKSFKFDVVP